MHRATIGKVMINRSDNPPQAKDNGVVYKASRNDEEGKKSVTLKGHTQWTGSLYLFEMKREKNLRHKCLLYCFLHYNQFDYVDCLLPFPHTLDCWWMKRRQKIIWWYF